MPLALVVSDDQGALFEIPELRAVVPSGFASSFEVSWSSDFIRVPGSATLLRLPGRRPVGYDPVKKDFRVLKEYRGIPVWAAACVWPAGYLSLGRPAYSEDACAPNLPLYSYSALAWNGKTFVASGTRIDADRRFDPDRYCSKDIEQRAREKLRRFKGNRMVSHLVNHCVLRYGCPTARSFVMGDTECAIPVSRRCNASCLGCISHQEPKSGVMASQHRIDFLPTAQEICEYAAAHLKEVQDPIVSFGQGCEGEPLLEARLIGQAIRRMRKETPSGLIHINTNASLPGAVDDLAAAGLGSIRISLISARPETYARYHRPAYDFANVLQSITAAKKHNIWISLNLLVMPGLTDRPRETHALFSMIQKYEPKMIQLRNLNIDPDLLNRSMGLENEKPMGMRLWLARIREEFPRLRLGCFNPSLDQMRSPSGANGAPGIEFLPER